MIRDIDENLISPEKLLHANDMVRLGCNDCSGCCDCCRDRAERITLDKWDMDRLKEGLQKSFDDLLALGSIEITLETISSCRCLERNRIKTNAFS